MIESEENESDTDDDAQKPLRSRAINKKKKIQRASEDVIKSLETAVHQGIPTELSKKIEQLKRKADKKRPLKTERSMRLRWTQQEVLAVKK